MANSTNNTSYDLPQISETQMKIRQNISKLKIDIQSAIDEICKAENYNITYAEINTALLDVLKSNVGFELREIMTK